MSTQTHTHAHTNKLVQPHRGSLHGGEYQHRGRSMTAERLQSNECASVCAQMGGPDTFTALETRRTRNTLTEIWKFISDESTLCFRLMPFLTLRSELTTERSCNVWTVSFRRCFYGYNRSKDFKDMSPHPTESLNWFRTFVKIVLNYLCKLHKMFTTKARQSFRGLFQF